ncbi:hypothetical protein ACFQT0_30085 [Hymenobacter humi]|uniref:Uncharacterized protein n=1 Tax=Hymenobacter humi TaxID=1411620 RepID=A0ABW2UEC6_9BACT
MNQDLQRSLDDNAKQWLALSHTISAAEQQAFDIAHDGLLATHGSVFMGRVYRATFGQVLQNMTDTERRKLTEAFRRTLALAIAEQLPPALG